MSLLFGEALLMANIKGEITGKDRRWGLLFSNNPLSRMKEDPKRIASVPSKK